MNGRIHLNQWEYRALICCALGDLIWKPHNSKIPSINNLGASFLKEAPEGVDNVRGLLLRHNNNKNNDDDDDGDAAYITIPLSYSVLVYPDQQHHPSPNQPTAQNRPHNRQPASKPGNDITASLPDKAIDSSKA